MNPADKGKLKTVIIAAVIFAAVAVMTYATIRNSQRHNVLFPDVDAESEGTDLGDGIFITGVGRYNGAYMEDGSNDIVTDVLMITVENRSDRTLRYGEIVLSGRKGAATFTVTTLPPKGKAVLLEKTRMEYRSADSFAEKTLNNRVFFDTEPTVCDDKIKLGVLDGKLNVTNLTDARLDGDITIYYKNYRDGYYYGGITYRATVEGGLDAGEVRQINAAHYSVKGSTVMFVTCP